MHAYDSSRNQSKNETYRFPHSDVRLHLHAGLRSLQEYLRLAVNAPCRYAALPFNSDIGKMKHKCVLPPRHENEKLFFFTLPTYEIGN